MDLSPHRARPPVRPARLVPPLLASAFALAAPPAAQEAPPPAPAVSVEHDAGGVRVLRAGALLLEVARGADGLKPYVRRLLTPAGVELARDAPPDHEHHHGLMLALGVDDVDYWGERYATVAGVQRERALEHVGEQRADGSTTCLSQAIDWLDPRDGHLQLRERRDLVLHPTEPEQPVLLTWRSALAVPEERDGARLWGRHYFGLGLRFAAALDGHGHFLYEGGGEAEVVRGDERLVRARWCAYAAESEGRPVVLVLFDHPRNPRHPARFFTMASPFAYLSATLDLAAEPLALGPGETCQLTYGLALWDGQADPQQIEAAYRAWLAAGAGPEDDRPRTTNPGDDR